MELEPPGDAFFTWSRSGADPRRLKPELESAPGPWPSGAGAAAILKEEKEVKTRQQERILASFAWM